MLLDEPFSALDAGLREAMRDMVGDALKAARQSLRYSSPTTAPRRLSFADHLAIMRDGALIQGRHARNALPRTRPTP